MAGNLAYVTTDRLSVEDEEALATWLKDPAKPKVLHDAKGPMLAFAARGMPLAGLERDTALSAYLARPDQRSYDLADLTVRDRVTGAGAHDLDDHLLIEHQAFAG